MNFTFPSDESIRQAKLVFFVLRKRKANDRMALK